MIFLLQMLHTSMSRKSFCLFYKVWPILAQGSPPLLNIFIYIEVVAPNILQNDHLNMVPTIKLSNFLLDLVESQKGDF